MVTSTRGKSARHAVRRNDFLKPTAAAIAVAACFAAGAAHANPTGATVVRGQVSVQQAGNLLQVTNSPNSIINWQSFSIGANEITRFLQQSSSSSVLNRVTGAAGVIDPSLILGALQSNGRVFLINPSGIVFGVGSQIDVAGLVASSLNLSNQDFLAGRLRFTGVPGAGSVLNEGNINAASGGQVFLVGPAVTNSGVITAPNGDVVLAAGNRVELVNPGTPNLRVEINAPDNEAVNLGRIVANSGRVGIYAGLIDQRGTIRADAAVAGEDGRILLKATKDVNLAAGSVTAANGERGGAIEVNAGDTTLVAGTVKAKGSSDEGGTINLLGDKVGVYGEARVDASGERGGGTVLVGGNFQGKRGYTAVEGTRIDNATATFFGEDASIAADAIRSGNGGRVILWADDTTRSYGAISARGGDRGGNGGVVETSGKIGLEVTRGPDVRAPRGIGGTWLIDPNDLEVVAGSVLAANSSQPLFSTLGESSRIGVDLINLQLNFGSNVLLTTASLGPVDGAQEGNLVISAPIIKTATGPDIGPGTLFMRAHNNIVCNGAGGVCIASTGDPLNVSMRADTDGVGGGGVAINGRIDTNGGSMSIQGTNAVAINSRINTNGGHLSFQAADTVAINDRIVTNGGSLFVQATGAVAVNAPVSTGNLTGGGSISLNSSANAVNIEEAVTSGAFFSARGETGVAVNAPVTTLNNSFIQLVSNSGPVAVNGALTGGGISATAGTGVTVDAALTALGGNSVTLVANAGPVTVNRRVEAGFFNATASAGPVTVNAPVESSFFTATAGGSGNLLTIAAPVTATGGVTLTADDMQILDTVTNGGSLTLRQNTFGTPIVLGGSAAGSLSLSQSELARLDTAGSVTIGNSSTGNLTVAGAVNLGSTSVDLVSGATFAVNGGASVSTDVPLSVNAPTINIGGTVNAQRVSLATDNLAVSANVNSDSDINVTTRSFFRTVRLGVAGDSGTSLDLSASELNRFNTGNADVLRIGMNEFGSTNAGPIQVNGAIAPANTQTLLLASNSTITQNAEAPINVNRLGLRASGDISLPADNDVGTLAAIQFCCSARNFSYTSAPNTRVTIGTVDGITGVGNTTGNAVSDPARGTFITDRLDVLGTSLVSFDFTTITPRSDGVRLELGSTDPDNASGVLRLSATDISRIFGTGLKLRVDEADITANVTPGTTLLEIAPVTAGREIRIVTGDKNSGRLEFNPEEILRVSVNSLTLGDADTGAVRVNADLDGPTKITSIGTFRLHSGSRTAGITVNNPLTSTGTIVLTADAMHVNEPVTVEGSNRNLVIGTNTPGWAIHLGNKPTDNDEVTATALGLSSTETGRLRVPNGTLVIGESASGNVNVTDDITFADGQIGNLRITSGGTLRVDGGEGTRLRAPGAILLTAPNIVIDNSVTAVQGDITLIANTMDISADVNTTGSDIIVAPLSNRDIHLGSDDIAGSALGLTATELNRFDMVEGGVLRIGDLNQTRNIEIRGRIDPANTTTLSLVTNNGSITQEESAPVNIANLAARARFNITLDVGNTVDNLALSGGNVSFRHAGPNPLVISTVDGMSGVNASGDAVIIANQLDIDSSMSANRVFIAPRTAERTISIVGAAPKDSNELSLFASEIGSISANSITLGDDNSGTGIRTGDVNVGAALNLGGRTLNLVSDESSTIRVDAALNATSGGFSFTGGNLNVGAAVTTTFGSITAVADSMAFNAMLTATNDTIAVRPLNSTTMELAGGANGGVHLSTTSLSNLSGRNITIGGTNVSSITSNGAVTLNATGTATLQTGTEGSIDFGHNLTGTGGVTLLTGNSGSIDVGGRITAGGSVVLQTGSSGDITLNRVNATGNINVFTGASGDIALNAALNGVGININAGSGGSVDVNAVVKATGDLSVTTDNISLPGGSKLAGANVTLNTASSGRDFVLGQPSGSETHLGLSAGEAGRIATPGTFTVNAGGILTVAHPDGDPITFAVYNPTPDTGVNNLALNAATINTTSALRVPDTITLRADAMSIDATVQSTRNEAILVAPRFFTSMSLGGGASGLGLTAAEIERFVTDGPLRLGVVGGTSSILIDGAFDASHVGSLTLAANGDITQNAGATITASRLRLQNFGTIDLSQANDVGTLAGGNNFSFSTFTFGNAGNLNVGQEVDGVAGLQGNNIVIRTGNINIAGPGTLGTAGSTVNLAPFESGAAMNLGSNPGGTFGVDADELSRIAGFFLTFGNATTGNVTVSDTMQRAAGTLNIQAATTSTVNVNGALGGPSGVSIQAGTINVSQPISSTLGAVNLTSTAAATLNIDAQVSANTGVGLFSDVVNIGAPIVTNFGTVTIAPFTAGRAISVGTEMADEMSLTQAELNHITAPAITIGSFSAGALTVRSGISLGVGQLSLHSGGPITQAAGDPATGDPGAPIIFTGVDVNGRRFGNLTAISSGGAVTLAAANEVPGFIGGSAANGSADFVFNNVLPMKLQFVAAVSAENFPSGSGRVLINAGPFVASPPPVVDPGLPPLVIADEPFVLPEIVDALNKLAEIGKDLQDAAAVDKKKAEEEKKKQVCN